MQRVVLIIFLLNGLLFGADNMTEFGIADDLIVLGKDGDYTDPDVEIKGFTVFGATQAVYTAHISSGAGNVIINGLLGISN